MIKPIDRLLDQDFYLKAPRFIDHHLSGDRTVSEVTEAKNIVKKIVAFCVDKNSQGKVVINLKRTEHIARACIKVFIPFAQSDRNFIICDPNEVVVQKLLKYGFPKSNIRVSSARQLNRAG